MTEIVAGASLTSCSSFEASVTKVFISSSRLMSSIFFGGCGAVWAWTGRTNRIEQTTSARAKKRVITSSVDAASVVFSYVGGKGDLEVSLQRDELEAFDTARQEFCRDPAEALLG